LGFLQRTRRGGVLFLSCSECSGPLLSSGARPFVVADGLVVLHRREGIGKGMRVRESKN